MFFFFFFFFFFFLVVVVVVVVNFREKIRVNILYVLPPQLNSLSKKK